MKNKSFVIFLISLLSIISIGLIIFMINVINGNFHVSNILFSSKVSNQLIINETYDTIFEKITIDTSSSDIEIKNSNDQKIKVVVYGEKNQASIKTSNQELSISSKEQTCIGFCFNKEIAKIEVYLPENYSHLIDIKNNYGDIKIESFLNANINVDEDCGDVSIIGGNEVTINNNYGDIKVEKSNILKIKAAAGDVKIGEVKDAIVENDYGNIEITYVSNYLDIKEDCGDVKIDQINLNKSSKISNNLGDIKIGSTNEIFIDAKTDLGDEKINNNYPKSDIKLTVENDCGDITINN